MKYLCQQAIQNAFADHLRQHLGYNDIEVTMATEDFPNPWDACYILEKYVDDVTIDGCRYEQYASVVDFSVVGADAPYFFFYSFYKKSEIRRHTIAQYKKATKWYAVADADDQSLTSLWR